MIFTISLDQIVDEHSIYEVCQFIWISKARDHPIRWIDKTPELRTFTLPLNNTRVQVHVNFDQKNSLPSTEADIFVLFLLFSLSNQDSTNFYVLFRSQFG